MSLRISGVLEVPQKDLQLIPITSLLNIFTHVLFKFQLFQPQTRWLHQGIDGQVATLPGPDEEECQGSQRRPTKPHHRAGVSGGHQGRTAELHRHPNQCQAPFPVRRRVQKRTRLW